MDNSKEEKMKRIVSVADMDPDVVHACKSEQLDFDPDEEIPELAPVHLTSYCETMMHILKGNIGAGMLAMGDAYKNGGMFVAPPLLIIIGALCIHCDRQLLMASAEMQRRTEMERAPSFGLTMQLCCLTGHPKFKKVAIIMKRICNTFLIVTQLGFCCVYFVFVPNNVKQVMDHYNFVLNIHYHQAIILLPIMLTCMIRNLKYLAWCSLIANILLATGVVIICYYIFQDLPSITERSPTSPLETVPLFLGTAFFAFEGIGLILPLQREMKVPEKFVSPFGVLNVGMTIVIALFTFMGFFSYLKYGDDIQGSVTLNLPITDILGQMVRIMTGIAMLLTFPLQMYIPISILWLQIARKHGPLRHPIILELGFRACFVLITFVLAEVVPYLGLFISLVGSISSTALALIFPPIMELLVYYGVSKLKKWVVIKDVIIILIGVVATVTGTYSSIVEIVVAFKKENLE